jgi:biopolymer transport protein ExbB/TolQ
VTAAALTFGVAVIVDRYAVAGSWLHDFFFNRRFVQWVLIFTFFIGLLGVVRRLPELRRNLAFARRVDLARSALGAASAPPRWRRVIEARSISNRAALGVYLGALKEREASEIDAGYRVPTDITQLLPLIGFFGTVFGLSIGLYNAFLVQGDSTTRSFASAIAIAFDNTLLGLALTIVLFAVTSLVRKMDESISARIENLGNEALQALCLAEPFMAEGTAQLERGLDTLQQSSLRLAEVLPLVVHRVEALKEVMRAASVTLANAVQEQTGIASALVDLAKDFEGRATTQAELERTIKKALRDRDRAHIRLLNALKRAITQRNRELVRGLTTALRQPRSIIVTDAPDPPGRLNASGPRSGGGASDGSVGATR